MSRASSKAGDDITKLEDSTNTETVPPPAKKAKTEAPEKRRLRRGNKDDPEYLRQRDMFEEQFNKSEGYDVDWDKLYYRFPAMRFEWAADVDEHLSKKDLMDLLIKTAIDEDKKEYETDLRCIKYVSANVEGVQGFLFYITFEAVDHSDPNPQPELYQTMVRKFADEITVYDFRLKPTQ